jgi:ribosomal protein L12E/L44/L45/RPP1/RPP2
MAKGLPYFKFTPTEWLTGDICCEDFEVQGLFINICALYWQRDGILSVEDINKRYKKPTAFDSLIDRFISVNDGLITIDFLKEQLEERGHKSVVNSTNGKLGGRPKTKATKPNANRTLSETKANESQQEEEEEQEKEKDIPTFSDFLKYVKTLKSYKQELDYAVKVKYNNWVDNKWRDGNNDEIKNWKNKIMNTMAYMKVIVDPNKPIDLAEYFKNRL